MAGKFPWIISRVRIVENSDLYLKLSEREPNRDWGSVIGCIYSAWLRAYKGPPDGADRWHLAIGYNRDDDDYENTLLAKWSAISGFNSDLVEVHICLRPEETKELTVCASSGGMKEESYLNGKVKASILFDNHCAVFHALLNTEEMPAFMQELSGTKGAALFRLVDSPPAEAGLAFEWFIYSLVEAALTKVAVFDERLSFAMLRGGIGLISDSLRLARVYPVNSIRDSSGPLVVASAGAEKGKRKLSSIILSSNDDETPVAEGLDCDWDFHLIHLGLLEQGGRKNKISSENHLQELRHYKGSTMVITSGRGGATGQWGRKERFAGFSELGPALCTALDKVSVARAALEGTATRKGGM